MPLFTLGALLSLLLCSQALVLGDGGLVMEQPSAGAPPKPAKWTGASAQKWIALPSKTAPGTLTFLNAATGQSLPARAKPQKFILLTPPAPTVQVNYESVTLNWPPVSSATGYAVARAAAPGGAYTRLGMADGTTYTDTTATPGTTYYYVVAAQGTPLTPLRSEPIAACPETTQTNVPVNLAPWFNVTGIQPDGWKWPGEGLDGAGHALSAALVSNVINWNGTLFTLGPPARSNCVSDAGQRIILPSGNFSSLLILGASLTGTVTFKPRLTYTDGSSAVLSQPMTSWRGSAKQAGESNAVTCAYGNTANGGRQTVKSYVHGYQLALDPTKTVQWLDLPSAGQVRLLAMTLNAQASVLSHLHSLASGEYITSPSKTCFLMQQPDGNLALYSGSGPSSQGAVLWASSPHATPGSFHTVLQDDGNLVTYADAPDKTRPPGLGQRYLWKCQCVSSGDGCQTGSDSKRDKSSVAEAIRKDDDETSLHGDCRRTPASLAWLPPGECSEAQRPLM